MFSEYPSYDRYRTLRLIVPQMRGEDCYALQTALVACGSSPGTVDGVFGDKTTDAVIRMQSSLGLVVDGLVGGKTQEALARQLAAKVTASCKIAPGLMRGQLEHESGWRLGNYSARREDGSYDAGVAQRNTNFTSPEAAFRVQESIEALANNTRSHYDKFAGIISQRRRWALAAGAWNAPAYACYIAMHEGAIGVKARETAKPSALARTTLDSYIFSVTSYLTV